MIFVIERRINPRIAKGWDYDHPNCQSPTQSRARQETPQNRCSDPAALALMLLIVFGCFLAALTIEQNVRQFQIPLQPSGSLVSENNLPLWRTRLSAHGSYRL